MVRVTEKTAFIDIKTPASEIKDVREFLMEHSESIDEIVLEGGIENLQTSILFQLMLSVRKSYPKMTIRLFEGETVNTPSWGRWELL